MVCSVLRQIRRRNSAYLDALFDELELGKDQMAGKYHTEQRAESDLRFGWDQIDVRAALF